MLLLVVPVKLDVMTKFVPSCDTSAPAMAGKLPAQLETLSQLIVSDTVTSTPSTATTRFSLPPVPLKSCAVNDEPVHVPAESLPE